MSMTMSRQAGMWGWARRRRGGSAVASKGQSLVELALIMPFLLVLLLGVLDLGRVFFSQMAVINAAREGARYGAMYPTDTTGITAHVTREAQGTGLVFSSISVSCPSGACAKGNPIRVTVRFNFQLLTTYVVGAGTIPLTATTDIVVF